MTYADFRKTYSWTLKNYSGTYELYKDPFDSFLLGKCTTTKYEKCGRRWSETSCSTEDVTPAFYFNCVEAVPFFRGLGGKERVTMGYCVRGYVPLEISSISPDGQTKIVRTFKLF